MKVFLRLPDVCERTGKPKSTIYREIGDGLLTPPVRIGKRTSGWPDSEIDAINRARLSGQTDGDIKKLVANLLGARLVGTSQSMVA